MNNAHPNEHRCGFVALCGRPNVGKSTLFNRLIGHHLAAVSHKPQTTRYNIKGILTEGNRQIIFVDSPGLYEHTHYPLNRMLNRHSKAAMQSVNLVLFMIDCHHWVALDAAVLAVLKQAQMPAILVLNKIDLLKNKQSLLKMMAQMSQHKFAAVVPLSAKKDRAFDRLKSEIYRLLPQSEFIFEDDKFSAHGQNFITRELIYEQIMHCLHEELPYSIQVEVLSATQRNQVLHLEAVIWVARDSQRAIVIGQQGKRLKMIGSRARQALQAVFKAHLFLKLHVKTRTKQQNARLEDSLIADLSQSEVINS